MELPCPHCKKWEEVVVTSVDIPRAEYIIRFKCGIFSRVSRCYLDAFIMGEG